jgi:hypothetical protein
LLLLLPTLLLQLPLLLLQLTLLLQLLQLPLLLLLPLKQLTVAAAAAIVRGCTPPLWRRLLTGPRDG